MKLSKEEELVGKVIKTVSREYIRDGDSKEVSNHKFGKPTERVVIITSVETNRYGDYEMFSGNCILDVAGFLSSTNRQHCYLQKRNAYEKIDGEWVDFNILDYISDIHLKELHIADEYTHLFEGKVYGYKTYEDYDKENV